MQHYCFSYHIKSKSFNMRRIFIYSLIFSLGLFSCSREDFTGEWDEEIVIPPSEEIEATDINGIVRNDDGAPISNALIELFNSDSLVISTNSTPDGAFVLYDLLPIYDYVLKVSTEEHIILYSGLSGSMLDQNVEFILDADLGTISLSNPLDPLDEDVVWISGRIDAGASQSFDGLLYYAWNDHNRYATRTHLGAFLIPVPKGTFLDFSYFDACLEHDVVIAQFGPFNSDTDVGNLLVSSTGIDFIQGFVSICDDFFQFGQITYVTGSDSSQLNIVPLINGSFSFPISPCDFNQNSIVSVDLDGEVYDIDDFIILDLGNFIILDLCDQSLSGIEGTLEVTINNVDNFQFTEFEDFYQFDSEVFFLNAYDNDRQLSLMIYTEPDQDGLYDVQLFYFIGFQFYFGDFKMETSVFELDGITGQGMITGNFSGTAINDLGHANAVVGSLDIEIID